jgi:hypothetical protein
MAETPKPAQSCVIPPESFLYASFHTTGFHNDGMLQLKPAFSIKSNKAKVTQSE